MMLTDPQRLVLVAYTSAFQSTTILITYGHFSLALSNSLKSATLGLLFISELKR